jgi:hypothetical protein
MARNLPEVGKIYKEKTNKNKWRVLHFAKDNGGTWLESVELCKTFVQLENFWKSFEELPNNSSQNEQLVFKVLKKGEFEGPPPSKEVLARHERYIKDNLPMDIIKDSLKQGIDSLKNFNNYLDEKYPNCKNKIKSKLSWKDVSELPKSHRQPQCFFKFADDDIILGRIMNNECYSLGGDHEFPKEIVKEFRTLTDLINSIESMLSRQDEPEERIKKLEGND